MSGRVPTSSIAPASRERSRKAKKETNVKQQTSKRSKMKKSDQKAYDKKKILSQCMLNFALLSANVCLLRGLSRVGPRFETFIAIVVLIAISILLQIVVGIMHVFIGSTEHFNDIRKRHSHRMVTASVVLLVLVLIVNIFSCALTMNAD